MEYKLDQYEEIKVSYTYREFKPWKILKNINLKLSNGDIAVIPKGYMTDFASVPKFLWGLFAPYGMDLMAFLIHDFCYDYGGYYKKGNGLIKVDKKFADNEMKYQQLKVGVKRTRVYPMYLAVKLFGRYKK